MDELLVKLRATFDRYATVTMIVIDEYQLRLATDEFIVVAETEWVLRSPDGKAERLDADFRRRSVEAYAICRIIGCNILSVDFDYSGSLVLGFDAGRTLTMLKRDGGFESFNIGFTAERSGPYIF